MFNHFTDFQLQLISVSLKARLRSLIAEARCPMVRPDWRLKERREIENLLASLERA